MLMICGYAAIGMRISSGWINSVKDAIKKRWMMTALQTDQQKSSMQD